MVRRVRKQSNKKARSGPLGQVLPFFIALFAFCLPIIAFAAVEITKVEYDLPGSDDGREWIEITNKGSEAVDIAGFKLLEGGVKHKLTLVQGSWLLPPSETAVIADDPATFLSEHPSVTKSIYKSSFSLSNTGETISLVTARGTVESSLTYKAPPPQKTPPKTISPKRASVSASKKQTAAVAGISESSFAIEQSGGTSLPTMLPWYLGLGAVVGLGVVGALFALPKSKKELETKGESGEFEIE